MIPSTTKQLLIAENWTKIYQSYRNADFQSYDFETIRRVMVNYLQQNYPEDFNDYVDSSEYIALIDLIAYLGQNLSFRIDLNARENFLETASKRDSVLQLAQLISYAPSRNVPANGFLKITAIATTDNIYDSNGSNLSNTTIAWNDPTNSNWYNQFLTIINSAMPTSYIFGTPYGRQTIDGILTEQYRINSNTVNVPVFSFTKSINGISMNFEVVSSTFSGKTTVYEEAPRPGNAFSLIYKNDNQGSGSANTGFFVHFRQGNLGRSNFTISTPVPNELIGINTPDINNSDVWLWQVDSNNNYDTLWTQVPNIVGNNVIYNSLNIDERNIYSVTTRNQDQIDLNFADGSFGNLPKGTFNLLYRQSNGLGYSIKPEQMTGVAVDIPYTNKAGRPQTLTIVLSLQTTVSNSSPTETNASIQSKAPQAYYTQNRMVTGEDYNITPLTAGTDILKVKSIARVTSGLSKYFELSDVSGKYSKTNIFAADGILYKNTRQSNFEFTFNNNNDILSVITQRLAPIVVSPSMRSFYFDQYPRPDLSYLGLAWNQVNNVSGSSRGYFKSTNLSIALIPNVGSFTLSNLMYVTPKALIRFVSQDGTKTIWSTVTQVIGDGSNSGKGKLDDGTGPIILNNVIPSGYRPIEVIPAFDNVFSNAFSSELVKLCLIQKNFGLSFDKTTRAWRVIFDINLNLTGPFSLEYQGNGTGANLDASWLVAFTWTGSKYKVLYRLTDYIFESQKETAFYVDPSDVNYDFTNNVVVKDNIDILSFNTSPGDASTGLGIDYALQVDNYIVEPDGYINPSKIMVSFYDYNNSGQITDPDTFTDIVGTDNKFVYFKKMSDGLRYQLVDVGTTPIISTYSLDTDVVEPIDGQLYYFTDTPLNVIKQYSLAQYQDTGNGWVYQPDYFAYPGRSGLKFHYVHNSGQERRIDPSKSNVIDVYILTSSYDTAYRSWLSTGLGRAPLPPTSQGLQQNYDSVLEPVKTISDEIIYQPVSYKILFGSKADINLQASFKAVKNTSIPTSDNDLKTQIFNAINQFFSLENWEFGQTFNFSELSTYVMNSLTPYITNFVIVPTINNFGSLYEVACLNNEIFISGATVNDIEIIDAITASQLNSTMIITNSGS